MAAQAKLEIVEPPHEEDGATRFPRVYDGQEFVCDVTGLHLNKDLAVQARKVEIDFFKARGVHTKVPREPWMQVITNGLTLTKGTRRRQTTGHASWAAKSRWRSEATSTPQHHRWKRSG